MRTHSGYQRLVRFGASVLALLMLIMGTGVARAQDPQIFMGLTLSQTLIGIGQTAKLYIVFSSSSLNPTRITSLQCTHSGSAVSASSITPAPTTLGVYEDYFGTQTYRGVSTGTTSIQCYVTAVDTVTGVTYTGSNLAPVTLDVIPQMGLGFTAYSATQVATVGQSVFVIAKFVNRGKTAYTNLNLSCVELGRALISVTNTPIPTVLLPGQSSFVEDRWLAVRTGVGNISCAFTATESVSGKSVTLHAPLIYIAVK